MGQWEGFRGPCSFPSASCALSYTVGSAQLIPHQAVRRVVMQGGDARPVLVFAHPTRRGKH